MLDSFRVLICKVFAKALVLNLFKVLVSKVSVHTTVVTVVKCQGITANLFQAIAFTSLFLSFEFLSFNMFVEGKVHLLEVDALNARCHPVSFATKLGPCGQPSSVQAHTFTVSPAQSGSSLGSMHQSVFKMSLSISAFVWCCFLLPPFGWRCRSTLKQTEFKLNTRNVTKSNLVKFRRVEKGTVLSPRL